MNISLPDDLKARMDGVAKPINWSGVAAKAFDEKLQQLVLASHEKSMADVVERLRSSRAEYVRDEPEPEVDPYGEGLVAGMRWASEVAEWPQLAQLESVSGEASPADWAADPKLVEQVHAALAGEARAAFWTAQVGEARPPVRTVHGFSDGALAIFEQVLKRI